MPVHASPKTMRATLTAALLLSTLLAACATDKDVLTAKNIPQSSTLKVHPGLINSSAADQATSATSAPGAPTDQARQPK